MEINTPLYKQLSSRLFDLFIVDDLKYGRQNDNGTYKLLRSRITPATIDDMLQESKSLLTYQEIHTLRHAFIKWVCIDLDIDKQTIGDDEVKESDLILVKKSADVICEYLKNKSIPYLLEFSGRRGFHVWIIFEELQTKADGYKLVNLIRSNVILEDNVNADLFPKTSTVNKGSKMVGLGVKLPTSQHKSSGRLSFFIDNSGDFNFDKSTHLSTTNENFYKQQLEILVDFQPVSTDSIKSLIDEYDELQARLRVKHPFLAKKKIESIPRMSPTLEGVLKSLKKCEHLNPILENYQQGLSGQNRGIMVGLLGQLKSEKDPDLGYHLLNEFFSGIQGYRKELTEQKLKFSELYFPVSCEYLGKCSTCTCSNIESPIELIDGIKLIDRPPFTIANISSNIFETIVAAHRRYSYINDEIPLYNELKKLSSVSLEVIVNEIARVFQGDLPDIKEVFTFQRNEVSKVRTLHSIDNISNIVSTYFLFVLNSLFYSEISQNSLGYRVAPGFYNSNIFTNWFVNWSIFSKNIQQLIEGEEYRKYYLVKVDIKSFYDRVDLQRLQVKLYEEAPPKIDEKIKQLDEKSRIWYHNIIKYLIKISRQTTGNIEKGLPQGPAYARFLADFYLAGLDRLIEDSLIKDKRREYYYRFVDDIFIFVEDQPKAKEVLKSIEKWASINSLELNPTKTEVSNVYDYFVAGKFKRYQDDAKYSINKANKNKNVLSEAEVQEAIEKLDSITNDTKFGIKDNVRFFYYQFSGDARLKHIRAKLARILPFSSSGRGTLFLLFYSDLYDTQRDFFWSLVDQAERMQGLSLGHYLNTILLNEETANGMIEHVETLLLGLYNRIDLEDIHKSLTLTLSLKYKLKIPPQFLLRCSKKLIHSAMETPDIVYTEDNYLILEQMLAEKFKVDFISAVHNIISNHQLADSVSKNLAKYVFVRFSEWKDNMEMTTEMKKTSVALQYYHCLCFLTLFEHSEDPSSLTAAWEILLKVSPEIDLDGKKITFDWINNAIENYSGQFSSSSYNLLLAQKEGSELSRYKCRHNFIELFLDILVIFHFAKKLSLDIFKEESRSFIDKNSMFGKWLSDNTARLYPLTDTLCVKNLALNGVIVLKNDTHIFVKNINGELPVTQFPYLDLKSSDDESELEIAKDHTNLLQIYRPAIDFSTLLKDLAERIILDTEFIETYQTNFPVYYNYPYLVENKTIVPFYSTFEKKVAVTGVTQKNDTKSYWENLFMLAIEKNPSLFVLPDENNPFNFNINLLHDRFFPKSETLLNKDEDKLEFIKVFAGLVKNHPIITAFDFQYLWLSAIWTIIDHSSYNSNDKFNLLLNIHFTQFAAPSEMAVDVLFAVDHRTKLKNATLDEFFTTIRLSLISFQNEVMINDFNIVDLLDEEIKLISDVLFEKDRRALGDFKILKLEFTPFYNVSKLSSDVKVSIKSVDLSLTPIYVYDRETGQFWSKTNQEIYALLNQKRYYVDKQDDGLWIFVPEFEILKSYDRIAERRHIYDSAKENVQFKKVFPKDDFYGIAKKEYEEYDTVQIEKKLSMHYSATEDIQERIINWLSIFNEESITGSKVKAYMDTNDLKISNLYRSVLEVIGIHKSIAEEDIQIFKSMILDHLSKGGIVFPLKHPGRDENGLNRLLNRAQIPPRKIDFEGQVEKLYTLDLSGKKIMLLADLSITGSQMVKALDYYGTVYASSEELNNANVLIKEKNERYFTYSSLDQAKICNSNFANASEIVIVSPMVTDVFIDAIQKHTIFAGVKPSIAASIILKNKEYFLGSSPVNKKNRDLFNELIKDSKLIATLFDIPEKLDYKGSVRKNDELNVLLRIGSLPRRHIQLFSLESRNGRLKLLDYIHNWGL